MRCSKCEYIFVGPLRCRKVRSRGSCHAINIAFASKPPLRSNTTRSRTISEHYFDPSLRLKNILVILSSISITKYRSEQISRRTGCITCTHIPVFLYTFPISFYGISNLRRALKALRYGKIPTKKEKSIIIFMRELHWTFTTDEKGCCQGKQQLFHPRSEPYIDPLN